MEKNYYEILEVDKKASPEIIKKSYSILAKKYHPDLQPEINKAKAEEQFKLINEAYETLSDDEKRKEYDSTLISNTIPYEKYNAVILENQELKNIINELHKKYLHNRFIVNNVQQYNNTKNDTNSVDNTEYYQENTTYNKTYKNNIFLRKIKTLFSIILTILIVYLLLKIPFIHNLLLGRLLK